MVVCKLGVKMCCVLTVQEFQIELENKMICARSAQHMDRELHAASKKLCFGLPDNTS